MTFFASKPVYTLLAGGCGRMHICRRRADASAIRVARSAPCTHLILLLSLVQGQAQGHSFRLVSGMTA